MPMSLYRDRITAPGLRDNDWAHTPYDDMRFAANMSGIGNREPGSSLRGVDDDVDDARAYADPRPSGSHGRGNVDTRRGPGPRVMSADTLAGDEVKNEAGETLGEIADIMIDVPAGRVAYAVMSVGGVLGVGDKLFAIPWKSLRLDPEHKCFRLDVAKARFDDAPGFDKDHWPTMADERWAREVHAYYNATPYWE